MKTGRFRARDLVVVAQPGAFQDPREPPLTIGDRARLNSGGTILLVVAVDGDDLTVAWRDRSGVAHERTLPRPCLHRARN